MDKKFNIRVYGLLVNKEKQVLLSDEFLFNSSFTKFPGGGLEFGEGTVDCVKREFEEELNIKVDVLRHFYTTDFFVRSAFTQSHQILSIYYIVGYDAYYKIPTKLNRYDFARHTEGEQVFRWKNISDLCEEDVSFPIDKKVISLLQRIYKE